MLINQHSGVIDTTFDHPRTITKEGSEGAQSRQGAPVVDDNVVHVESYDRRVPGAGRTNANREAERLFSDVITFLAQDPALDEGSLGKAVTMIETTRDYLVRHGRPAM